MAEYLSEAAILAQGEPASIWPSSVLPTPLHRKLYAPPASLNFTSCINYPKDVARRAHR